MNFLLDTNIVSQMRKARPHPELIAWLRKQSPDSLFMAAPTLAELQCGAGMTADAALAKRVQAWIDGIVQAKTPQIVPFGTDAALLLGRMWTTASLSNFLANDPRSRKAKSGADLTIAACAIAAGMVMVTDNVSDFLQIHAEFPLPGMYNPLGGLWIVGPPATVQPSAPSSAS